MLLIFCNKQQIISFEKYENILYSFTTVVFEKVVFILNYPHSLVSIFAPPPQVREHSRLTVQSFQGPDSRWPTTSTVTWPLAELYTGYACLLWRGDSGCCRISFKDNGYTKFANWYSTVILRAICQQRLSLMKAAQWIVNETVTW